MWTWKFLLVELLVRQPPGLPDQFLRPSIYNRNQYSYSLVGIVLVFIAQCTHVRIWCHTRHPSVCPSVITSAFRPSVIDYIWLDQSLCASLRNTGALVRENLPVPRFGIDCRIMSSSLFRSDDFKLYCRIQCVVSEPATKDVWPILSEAKMLAMARLQEH